MVMMGLPYRGHESAPGDLTPGATIRGEDVSQRYVADNSRSDLSDTYPAGHRIKSQRVVSDEATTEALGDDPGGVAVGGVPSHPCSLRDSPLTAVPGKGMEREDSVADISQDKRRTASIDIRLTESARMAIHDRANRLGVKPSAWARAVLLDALDKRNEHLERLHKASVSTPNPELVRVVEQVRRVGVNLNQTLRKGQTVNEDLLLEVLSTLNDLRAELGDRIAL